MKSELHQRKTMHRHIMRLLNNGRCSNEVLRKETGHVLGNWSEVETDRVFKEVLADLCHRDRARPIGKNDVTLTQSGIQEAKMTAEKKKQKAAQRSKKRASYQKSIDTRKRHENMKLQLDEIGRLLGKQSKQEHTIARSVRLDTVWFVNPSNISHAFEVQNNGELKNAIHNLVVTRQRYPACRLYLVAVDEGEMKTIKLMLEELGTPFVNVVKGSEMDRLLRYLKQIESKMKKGWVQVEEQLMKVGLAT